MSCPIGQHEKYRVVQILKEKLCDKDGCYDVESVWTLAQIEKAFGIDTNTRVNLLQPAIKELLQ